MKTLFKVCCSISFVLILLIGLYFGIYMFKCPSSSNEIVGNYTLDEYWSANHFEELTIKNDNTYEHYIKRLENSQWMEIYNEGKWQYNTENCQIILTEFQYESPFTKTFDTVEQKYVVPSFSSLQICEGYSFKKEQHN